MEHERPAEPTQSLADLIIESNNATSEDEDFSIETAPDRFFELHPSTCLVDRYIVCDHEVVRADRYQLMRLLDHPRATLNYPEATWLFERIKERVSRLNERYIVVSDEYIWDKETASILPIPPKVRTTNNRKTRERLQDD